jgi:hypothetical protein
MKNVPARSWDSANTWVYGILFTKIISLRLAMLGNPLGHPDGTAQYPKLKFHERKYV